MFLCLKHVVFSSQEIFYYQTRKLPDVQIFPFSRENGCNSLDIFRKVASLVLLDGLLGGGICDVDVNDKNVRGQRVCSLINFESSTTFRGNAIATNF